MPITALRGAMLQLARGYRQFRRATFRGESTPGDPDAAAAFKKLVTEGQAPKVAVVACCDSRVDPAIVTSSSPGDLFVCRNVANLVPPFEQQSGTSLHGPHHGTSASLEYAVNALEVTDILVFGHSQCGGIGALMQAGRAYSGAHDHEGTGAVDSLANTDFIAQWMNIAEPAKRHVLSHMVDATLEDQQRACERESLVISFNNLTTFPWIMKRVAKKELRLHAWYFDMSSSVEAYQPATRTFQPLLDLLEEAESNEAEEADGKGVTA